LAHHVCRLVIDLVVSGDLAVLHCVAVNYCLDVEAMQSVCHCDCAWCGITCNIL